MTSSNPQRIYSKRAESANVDLIRSINPPLANDEHPFKPCASTIAFNSGFFNLFKIVSKLSS